MKRLLLLGLLCCGGLLAAPPVIFYTDIISGPKVGGENNNGTILTICGYNFGATRGTSTVTIGGGAVAAYVLWAPANTPAQPCGDVNSKRTLDSISVAIGASAVTGAIKVTVGGVDSNTDKTFTVTTWSTTNNRIFCEDSVSGSDSNNGQFLTDTQVLAGVKGCWKNIRHVKGLLNTGDIVYFGSTGVNYQSEFDTDPCTTATMVMQTNVSGSGCIAIAHSGTIAQPISLIGYPGSIATIGCATTACPPTVFLSTTLVPQNWNIVNLTEVPGQCTVSGTPAPLHCTNVVVSGGASGGLRLGGSGGTPKNGPGGWRIVNNKSSCPNGNQPNNGCIGFTTNSTTNTPGTIAMRVYGNHFSNYTDYVTDTTVGWKHTIAVYLGFDANEIDFGWNDLDGSLGYSSVGLHIHSSAIGTTAGFPLYGIHIHDNYIHDTPAGNDMSTFDPSTGSGVEYYNNLYVHQGDCLAYPNAAQGWVQGYRRMGDYSVGQPAWDEQWSPMHGTINLFNNTYVDAGNCSGSLDGWLSVVAPSGSSAAIKPPPDVTICPSSCSITQTGTLPAASPTYAPENVGFQVSLNSTFITSLYDDGLGNLLENGVIVGTFNYGTGAYSFTLTEGSLNPLDNIKYRTIYGFKLNFKNNVIWQRAATPAGYLGTAVSSPILYPKVSGDHNLFFTTGGQSVPPMFTSNIGSNSNPLFVSQGTLGAIPSNGDYHLQSGSPGKAVGVTTTATRDFDGLVRTVPFDIGAFAIPSTTICVIGTTSCPTANTGVPYSCTVVTSGCASPSFSVASGLPVWASIGASSGIISGTPSGATPTTSNFTVAVADANGNPSQPLSILDCTPPAITNNPPITAGTAGVSYGPYTFTGTGDTPITWTSTGNPPGLTLNSGTGVLSGTPTLAGSYTIVVTATNACSVVNKSFPNTIIAPGGGGGPGGTVTVGGTVSIGTTVTK